MEAELKRLYYDPRTGFGSALHLYRSAKKAKVEGVRMKDCIEFIRRQETAQIHKGANEKQEKRQFHIESKRGYWQCDHAFMKHKKTNNGYKAIFVAVDIGSRYVYARAMKNIRETAVIETFEHFLKTVKPKNIKGIVNDKGTEFISKPLKEWLKNHDIEQRTLHPTYHYYSNAIVERFNGVLKQKLSKYMTSHGTKKWIDALDDIVYNNNRSIHSTTKQRPKDMLKSPLKQLIFRLKTINSNHNLRVKKSFVLNKIGKGSKIRIKRIPKDHFDKSYKKFNKKEHEVEAIVNGGVMVKVKGEDRALRPFEILPVGKEVEKNPLKRKVKSHDGKKRVRRIRNDALIRELQKKRKTPHQQDYTNRGVEFEINGETAQGKVIRMGGYGRGMFVEFIQNNKRYESRVMESEVVAWLENTPRLKIIKQKRTVERKEVEADDEDTLEELKYVNSQSLLAVKTDSDEKFWLAKPIGKARRAKKGDEQRSDGVVKTGKWFVISKWYDEIESIPLAYYLTKGYNYVDISSVYEVAGLDFGKVDKRQNKFTLLARDRDRILEAIEDDKTPGGILVPPKVVEQKVVEPEPRRLEGVAVDEAKRDAKEAQERDRIANASAKPKLKLKPKLRPPPTAGVLGSIQIQPPRQMVAEPKLNSSVAKRRPDRRRSGHGQRVKSALENLQNT